MDTCQCIPWDMIRPNGKEKFRICDRYSNECFYSKMKDENYAKESCHCLPDCNTIRFTYTLEQIPLNNNDICEVFNHFNDIDSAQKVNMQLKLEDWKKFLKLRNFKKYNNFLENRKNTDTVYNYYDSSDKYNYEMKFPKKMCEDLKNVAVIEIQIMDQSYLKMTRNIRISLFEQIGIIGGILGLFCGFNFLAILEIIYWICTCFLQLYFIYRNSFQKPNEMVEVQI